MPNLVKLRAGNTARAIVPNGGTVKLATVSGPVGPQGPAGPGGSGSMPKIFAPEDYGAAANGTADDASAIQAALNAAATAGGIVRFTGTYGWNGTLIVPDGVGIVSLSSTKGTGTRARLKALGSTSKIKFGDFSTGTGRLGAIRDLEIDGNSTGSTSGLVVIEAIRTHFENIWIHNGAGVGCYAALSQNCTFVSFDVTTHGTDSLVVDLGGGGHAFYRCEINGGSNRSLVVTQSGASSGGAYPFSPAHIKFDHCIFENNVACTSLIDIAAGNLVRFVDCGISQNNSAAVSSGYLVRVLNNPTYPGVATHAEFESCQLFGGSASQASAFYVQGSNYLTSHGHNFTQNTPYLYSYDGASQIEDLGVWQTTGLTAKWHALTGGSIANFIRRGIRPPANVIAVNASGATANLDTSKYAYFPILMNAVGASITTLNLNNAIGGEEITLYIAQTVGGGTITWPSSVKLTDGDPINSGALTTTTLHLHFDGTNWVETGRSVKVFAADSPTSMPTTSKHNWNPRKSGYNFKGGNLHKVRGAMAKVAHGDASCHIAFVGDSEFIGYNGTSYVYADALPRRFGARLADGLGISSAFTGGIHQAVAAYGSASGDRWTRTGGWVVGANLIGATNSAGTATWSSLDAGTSVEIYYADSGTNGVNWTIDGVAQTPLPTGGTTAMRKVTVSGLSNGTHTVVITTAAGQSFYVFAARVFNPSLAQLHIHNLAIGSSRANAGAAGQNWSDTTLTSSVQGLGWEGPALLTTAGITPDLVIVGVGGNDAAAGVAAGIPAGLANIRAYWPTAPMVLVHSTKVSTVSDATWDAVGGYFFNFADSQDLPYFDWNDFVYGQANGVTDGLIGADNTHPTGAGSLLAGRNLAELVLGY